MSGRDTAPRRVALIGGGVRSGKSAFALSLARSLGERRAFIATAEAFDDEMRARIDAHVLERGDAFVTVEEPIALPERIASLSGVDVVVVDCLTLWLSNLLLRDETEGRALGPIEERIEALAAAVESATPHVVLVSNEVGMGVVPESRLGRAFRDLSGRAHQRLGRSATELYVAVMGAILRLRPGPVALVGGGEDAR
ncbi:bifunctional adenosylcobinamide kinase/adenosylcobinamide-phosphate guanylyltransferase [Sorangium sp. So ce375]|uniref:bifunctional adenosylcobinamide kinase/adenosylcobinamide-phosphate guanylyltransferase n=1 Tax=Sorangium sp. So ce375 TaxID=3133306 RepID=UPI003F5C373A